MQSRRANQQQKAKAGLCFGSLCLLLSIGSIVVSFPSLSLSRSMMMEGRGPMKASTSEANPVITDGESPKNPRSARSQALEEGGEMESAPSNPTGESSQTHGSEASQSRKPKHQRRKKRRLRAPKYHAYPRNYAADPQAVVVEKYKLILYSNSKVGKTAWRLLTRKLMGYGDYTKGYSSKSRKNTGLKYLDQYSKAKVTKMMTDPTWTRALFVRDPKERLLSAYLDKAINDPGYIREQCCHNSDECMNQVQESLEYFVTKVMSKPECKHDDHWTAQSHVVAPEHWKYINFVGHMENLSADAKRLLQLVGAWEEHGKTGWGKNGDERVFAPRKNAAGRNHATDARKKLEKYYTPELERIVEEYYDADYSNPKLNLVRTSIVKEE